MIFFTSSYLINFKGRSGRSTTLKKSNSMEMLWLKDFEEAGFKEEVKPLILKENAVKMLGL